MAQLTVALHDADRTPPRIGVTFLSGDEIGFAKVLLCVVLLWIAIWWLLAGLGGWPIYDDQFYAKPIAFWTADGRWQAVRQYGALTASSIGHIFLGAIAHSTGPFDYRTLFLSAAAREATFDFSMSYYSPVTWVDSTVQVRPSKLRGASAPQPISTRAMYVIHSFIILVCSWR